MNGESWRSDTARLTARTVAAEASPLPHFLPSACARSLSSAQALSRVRLFVTSWTAARQASLSIANSQSLLKLTSIQSVMPSNHLILCGPLLLLPSLFPRVFSGESVLHIRRPKYWNFSFSISASKEYSGLILFRMDWLDLLAVQGTLKSLLQHHSSKPLILQCSAFSMVQLSHPYMTTVKTIALTRQTLDGKGMSLLCTVSIPEHSRNFCEYEASSASRFLASYPWVGAPVCSSVALRRQTGGPGPPAPEQQRRGVNGAGGRPSFQKEREGLAAGSRAQQQTAHAVLSQRATPPHAGSPVTLTMPGGGIAWVSHHRFFYFICQIRSCSSFSFGVTPTSGGSWGPGQPSLTAPVPSGLTPQWAVSHGRVSCSVSPNSICSPRPQDSYLHRL